jgi:Protein of unknown function (DUF3093)
VRIYRETLWPAPWLFFGTALVIPASLLVFLPISIPAGIATAIILYGGCLGLLIFGAPRVEVTASTLSAGRARLPISIVGDVEGFSGAEAQFERGIGLDARAWLMIRGWVSPVVKIALVDASDPTPYWIVSTRHPDDLVAAIAAAKAAQESSEN